MRTVWSSATDARRWPTRLKATAQKFIDWTLTNQQPDGWIGPRRNTDWWPNFVVLKVLTQYYEVSGDPRYANSSLAVHPWTLWGKR